MTYKKIFLFLFFLLTVEGTSKPISWSDASLQWNRAATELEGIKKPLVTFFGGSRFAENDPMYQNAFKLSMTLAKQGFAIITGGNQGIMKAANCGALEGNAQGVTSISINVKGLPGENSCATKKILVDDFFVRKGLMMQFSSAFVIFPGGIGTLDELAELVTLIFTRHLSKVPVYIVGTHYWDHLKKWFELGVETGLIESVVLDMIVWTDDLTEILNDLTSAKS